MIPAYLIQDNIQIHFRDYQNATRTRHQMLEISNHIWDRTERAGRLLDCKASFSLTLRLSTKYFLEKVCNSEIEADLSDHGDLSHTHTRRERKEKNNLENHDRKFPVLSPIHTRFNNELML